MKNIDNVISNYIGYFKFSERVTLADVKELAIELAINKNYVWLHIRKTSSQDQYALGFEYSDPNGDKDSFARFLEEQKDALLKRFGIGLAGWDVSAEYYRIK